MVSDMGVAGGAGGEGQRCAAAHDEWAATTAAFAGWPAGGGAALLINQPGRAALASVLLSLGINIHESILSSRGADGVTLQ